MHSIFFRCSKSEDYKKINIIDCCNVQFKQLGDRSDAFWNGLWNAEMTVLITKEKAELFVAAHEDKNVSRNESDGYPKTDHKYMDLNRKAARQ